MKSLRSYVLTLAVVIVQWNSLSIFVGLFTFIVHTQILKKSLSASQGTHPHPLSYHSMLCIMSYHNTRAFQLCAYMCRH